MNGRLVLQTLLGVAVASCASESDEHESTTPDAPELSLNGHAKYESDCSPEQVELLDEVLRWARVATNSSAFAQCVESEFQRLGNPSTFCAGDAFAGLSSAVQLDNLLNSTRSYMDVDMFCTGGNPEGNASAWPGDYGHLTPDTFNWTDQWFADLTASLKNPTCAQAPGSTLCRWLPDPWPFNQLAGTVVHEASHGNHYLHGDNKNNALAQVACGIPAGQPWDFQTDTLPYIVGNCASSVLTQSWQQCGNIRNGCGAGQLNLVTGYNATSCACARDPGWQVIGGDAGKVFVGGAGVFATFPGNGHILQYDGTPGSWTEIGGAGRQFAVNDRALYAITEDGSQVVEFSGGSWGAIGGPSSQIIAGGNQLYSIWPDTGDIYRYEGAPEEWTLIGGPGDQFVANDVDLYGRWGGGAQVLRFTGTPGEWDVIDGDSKLLVAGGDQIYSVRKSDDSIYRFDAGSRTWSVVGGPASGFAANRSGLYGRSSDGLAVYKLPSGSTDWETAGGPNITELIAGANFVVARHESGDLMLQAP